MKICVLQVDGIEQVGSGTCFIKQECVLVRLNTETEPAVPETKSPSSAAWVYGLHTRISEGSMGQESPYNTLQNMAGEWEISSFSTWGNRGGCQVILFFLLAY